MVGWIKMKLGKEVGLSPDHIVLDGDPTPHKRGTAAPNFRPMSIVVKRLQTNGRQKCPFEINSLQYFWGYKSLYTPWLLKHADSYIRRGWVKEGHHTARFCPETC